jgi:hypothetical protein
MSYDWFCLNLHKSCKDLPGTIHGSRELAVRVRKHTEHALILTRALASENLHSKSLESRLRHADETILEDDEDCGANLANKGSATFSSTARCTQCWGRVLICEGRKSKKNNNLKE